MERRGSHQPAASSLQPAAGSRQPAAAGAVAAAAAPTPAPTERKRGNQRQQQAKDKAPLPGGSAGCCSFRGIRSRGEKRPGAARRQQQTDGSTGSTCAPFLGPPEAAICHDHRLEAGREGSLHLAARDHSGTRQRAVARTGGINRSADAHRAMTDLPRTKCLAATFIAIARPGSAFFRASSSDGPWPMHRLCRRSRPVGCRWRG